jgi:hypothetical protein
LGCPKVVKKLDALKQYEMTHWNIFSFARLLVIALTVLGLQACISIKTETYVPKRGQMGKDVMWLPTSDDLAYELMKAANVGPNDLLVDLGAGDGKIPIAAAQSFKARAWGIEYNKDLANLANRNAQRAGVADKVHVVHGDIFKEDFSKATVVTLYLLEELNLQLRPTLLAMKPGTRILSNTFSMGDWEPDQVIRVAKGTGYFWTVPAMAKGVWSISGLEGSGLATLKLDQVFQRVGGTIQQNGKQQNLLGARMDGFDLHFSFVSSEGQLKSVIARVVGNSIKGEVIGPYGMHDFQVPPLQIEGRRQ